MHKLVASPYKSLLMSSVKRTPIKFACTPYFDFQTGQTLAVILIEDIGAIGVIKKVNGQFEFVGPQAIRSWGNPQLRGTNFDYRTSKPVRFKLKHSPFTGEILVSPLLLGGAILGQARPLVNEGSSGFEGFESELREAINLPKKVITSFRGSTFNVEQLDNSLIVYRISPAGKEKDAYWTTTPPKGYVQHSLDVATHPEIYLNRQREAYEKREEGSNRYALQRMFSGGKEIVVTRGIIPSGTIIYRGIAAPQINQRGFQGGIEQIYIKELDKNWVSHQDSSRQTQIASREWIQIQRTQPLDAYLKDLYKFKGIPFTRPSLSLANTLFKQTVQLTHLEETYNSTHPETPIRKSNASSGTIGGVGNAVGTIKGLDRSPTSFINPEHVFALPLPDGEELPFKDSELQQIIRELAHGIFVENQIPFFSLHFNYEAKLFPVLHPIYQNTLVGRVIGMLDYIMKAFLNGAYFEEDFIFEWLRNPSMPREEMQKHLKDFTEYAQTHLKGSIPYISLRDLMVRLNIDETHLPPVDGNPSMFRNRFQTSFRIIAKQSRIEMQDNMFLLHPDFDVEYTLEEGAEFAEYIRQHKLNTGQEPADVQALRRCYELMAIQIKELMPKLPMCRPLFHMLGVINFFCYYFSTLKQMGRVPVLADMPTPHPYVFPPVLPPLPIKRFKTNIQEQITVQQIYSRLTEDQQEQLKRMFLKADHYDQGQIPDELRQLIADAVIKCISALKFAPDEDSARSLMTQLLQFPYYSLLSSESAYRRKAGIPDYHSSYFGRKALNISVVPQYPDVKNKDEVFQRYLGYSFTLRGSGSRFELESREHQRETFQINGGCGMKLPELRLQPCSAPTDISDTLLLQTETLPCESWVPVQTEERQYAVFKLGITSEDDLIEGIQWFSQTLKPNVGALPDATRDLMNAILEQDSEKIDEALSRSDLQVNACDKTGTSPLHCAATMGDADTIRRLEAKGARAFKNIQGATPLVLAAFNGHLAAIEALVHLDSRQINSKMPGGATALYMAATNGKADTVTLLIRLGEDPNMTLENSMSALYSSLYQGFPEVALRLLDAPGIRMYQELEDGNTALHLASELGHEDVVKRLRAISSLYDTSPRRDGMTPIHLAAKYGHTTIFAMLIDEKPVSSINKPLVSGKTAFHLAAIGGHHGIITELNNRGILPIEQDMDGNTTLMSAMMNGQTEVALRLSAKSNPETKNKKGQTALDIAMSLGQLAVCKTILATRPEVPNSYIIFLVRKGHLPELISRLEVNPTLLRNAPEWMTIAAQNGQNLILSWLAIQTNTYRLPNVGDWQLIHYAARYNFMDLVRVLLKQVIKGPLTLQAILPPLPAEPDEDGVLAPKSVIYLAAENGSNQTLSLLLRQRLPLENGFGDRHVLYGAVQSGSTACVDQILIHIPDRIIHKPLDGRGKHAAHIAAANGDVAMMRFLRSRGSKFDDRDKEGLTCWHIVARHNVEEAYEFLFDKRLSLQPPDDLVFFTALEGNEAALENILKHMKPDYENPETGETCAHAAVKGRSPQALVYLKAYGADINKPDLKGRTPLMLAAELGLTTMVLNLLNLGADPTYQLEDLGAIDLAALNGHSECVKLLMAEGSRPTERTMARVLSPETKSILEGHEEFAQKTHIIKAIRTDAPSEIQNLEALAMYPMTMHISLEAGRNLYLEAHLLSIAAAANKPRCMDAFIKAGANINSQDFKGYTALHRLMETENEESIISFIETHKSKIDFSLKTNEGLTLLHLAAGKGLNKVVRVLLPVSDANAKSKTGESPLFYAVRENKVLTVSLLAQNISLRQRNLKGETVLYIAILKGLIPIAELFLALKMDIRQTCTFSRRTYLHAAVESKSIGMTLMVLGKGISPVIPDRAGLLPIHIAAGQETPDILKLLLASGSPADMASIEGRTPLHNAARLGRSTNIELLLGQGAKPNPAPSKTSQTEPGKVHPPVIEAAESGDEKSLQMLMRASTESPDPDQALAAAMRSGNIGLVEMVHELTGSNITNLQAAIVSAGIQNQIRGLELAIRLGYPVSATQAGFEALLQAASRGFSIPAKFLIQSGVNPHHRPELNQLSPLSIAATSQSLSTLEAVTPFDSDIHKEDKSGKRLVHIAAEINAIGVAAYLIFRQADIHVTNSQGLSAAQIAAEHGYFEFAAFMIAMGYPADAITSDGKTLAELAREKGHPKASHQLSRLQEQWSESQRAGDSQIHAAIRMNQIVALRLLLIQSSPIQVNRDMISPLGLAVMLGSVDAAISLVRAGVTAKQVPDLDKALRHAIETNNVRMVRALKKIGIESRTLRTQGEPLLLALVREGKKLMAKVLWPPKATATLNLTIANKDRIISALRDNQQNDLFFAMQAGARLQDERFDVDGESNATCLHLLALCPTFETVRETFTLATHYLSIPIDAEDKDGLTPLAYAAKYKRKVLADTLIGLGADLFYKDKNGLTPASIALLHNFNELQPTILSAFLQPENKEKVQEQLLASVRLGHPDLFRTFIEIGVPLPPYSKTDPIWPAIIESDDVRYINSILVGGILSTTLQQKTRNDLLQVWEESVLQQKSTIMAGLHAHSPQVYRRISGQELYNFGVNNDFAPAVQVGQFKPAEWHLSATFICTTTKIKPQIHQALLDSQQVPASQEIAMAHTHTICRLMDAADLAGLVRDVESGLPIRHLNPDQVDLIVDRALKTRQTLNLAFFFNILINMGLQIDPHRTLVVALKARAKAIGMIFANTFIKNTKYNTDFYGAAVTSITQDATLSDSEKIDVLKFAISDIPIPEKALFSHALSSRNTDVTVRLVTLLMTAISQIPPRRELPSLEGFSTGPIKITTQPHRPTFYSSSEIETTIEYQPSALSLEYELTRIGAEGINMAAYDMCEAFLKETYRFVPPAFPIRETDLLDMLRNDRMARLATLPTPSESMLVSFVQGIDHENSDTIGRFFSWLSTSLPSDWNKIPKEPSTYSLFVEPTPIPRIAKLPIVWEAPPKTRFVTPEIPRFPIFTQQLTDALEKQLSHGKTDILECMLQRKFNLPNASFMENILFNYPEIVRRLGDYLARDNQVIYRINLENMVKAAGENRVDLVISWARSGLTLDTDTVDALLDHRDPRAAEWLILYITNLRPEATQVGLAEIFDRIFYIPGIIARIAPILAALPDIPMFVEYMLNRYIAALDPAQRQEKPISIESLFNPAVMAIPTLFRALSSEQTKALFTNHIRHLLEASSGSEDWKEKAAELLTFAVLNIKVDLPGRSDKLSLIDTNEVNSPIWYQLFLLSIGIGRAQESESNVRQRLHRLRERENTTRPKLSNVNTNILNVLVKAGLKLDRSREEVRPVFIASLESAQEDTKNGDTLTYFLMKAGYPDNIRDKSGDTILLHICRNIRGSSLYTDDPQFKQLKQLEELTIRLGLDPFIPGRDGKTVFDLATFPKYTDHPTLKDPIVHTPYIDLAQQKSKVDVRSEGAVAEYSVETAERLGEILSQLSHNRLSSRLLIHHYYLRTARNHPKNLALKLVNKFEKIFVAIRNHARPENLELVLSYFEDSLMELAMRAVLRR